MLFVADEVICGFGRTGNCGAAQTFGLKPDMLSCAKALSAAFQPISALLINDTIYQAMLAESDKLGSFAPRLHLFAAIRWPRRSRWRR